MEVMDQRRTFEIFGCLKTMVQWLRLGLLNMIQKDM